MNPGPAAILGNGSLLATLSARAEVERLFWPSVDRGSHLGVLRFGLESDGSVEQSYLVDANVLLTRSGGVELTDLIPELEPVLLRRVRGRLRDGRLVVDCRPELDGVRGRLAASVDGNRVVFYRRDVALALGAVGAEAFATGLGETEGGISVPFSGDAVVALAFGKSSREAVARLDAALQQDFDELVSSRVRYDAARLARAESSQNGDVGSLYRRSLLALELLADRDSGSVIAAPELDPEFRHSGGYGFVWGRDLAFIILAFLAAGRDDLARRALRWLPTAQEPEGLWLQRHWTDGSLAPSWCRHQLDETGAILFAYEAAVAAARRRAAGRRPLAFRETRGGVPARHDRGGRPAGRDGRSLGGTRRAPRLHGGCDLRRPHRGVVVCAAARTDRRRGVRRRSPVRLRGDRTRALE